jgi:hypothetical protein
MTIERITGLRGPDRQETRDRQLAARVGLSSVAIQPIVIQPRAMRVRRQPALPDCVGCGLGGRVHGLTGFDPSDRDLWREAQRRETGTFDPNEGALLEYAVDGLMARGAKPYVPSEELDTSSDPAGWTEDLDAHDLRQVGAEHGRLDLGDPEELYVALSAGMAVFDGGGVTSKFMSRGPGQTNIPAGLDELGGDRNGHSQGVVGYWLGAILAGVAVGDLLLYAGSWDTDFAGCYVPVLDANSNIINREWWAGHFWAKAEVWSQRWDAHRIRVALP